MTIKHYAFGNLGRDDKPRVGSQRMDRDALIHLRESVPDEQAAVFLCEINEGDDNDELALVRKVFKGWRLYGSTTREPILLSPDQPRAKASVLWVPNTAVEHWSPQRSILTVNLADEPESLMGLHPAAGANGQGDRPKKYRQPLQVSWDATMHARQKRSDHLVEHGRNVTTLLDANAYEGSEVLLPGERAVWHDATDWGLVRPADGFAANFREGKVVPFPIDSHDGHSQKGGYRRTKRAA